MRKSAVFFLFTAANILLVVVCALHSRACATSGAEARDERKALVKSLQLTDLCLFTEARYTRHIAMADHFAPFQDHPAALEHFPSGSLVTPVTKRFHAESP